MLPRVAFEYGHTWWAAATRASACSRSMPGRVMRMATWMPKPAGMGPMPTSELIDTSSGTFSFMRAPTAFKAPMKQAA